MGGRSELDVGRDDERGESEGVAAGRERRRGGGGRKWRGRGRGNEATETKLPGQGLKKKKAKVHTMYSLTGGERVGSVLVTDCVYKRETEKEKEKGGEEERDAEVSSGGESRDSRTERLERFLKANLNLDSDPDDDEDDGFVLGGCGNEGDELLPLEDGCPVFASVSHSATAPLSSSAVRPGVSGGREVCAEGTSVSGSRFKLAGEEDDYNLDQFDDVPDPFEDVPGRFEGACDQINTFSSGGVRNDVGSGVMPASGKGEGTPCGGEGMEGLVEREGEEASDGWISDDNQFAVNYQEYGGMLWVCTCMHVCVCVCVCACVCKSVCLSLSLP